MKNNVIELPNKYYTFNQQGQRKFNHHLVKDEILEEQPIYRSDIGIVRYENGVYKRSNNGDILHVIQNKIAQEATTSRKREVLDLILHEHEAKPLSEFNKGARQLNLKNGLYNIQVKQFTTHTKHIMWTIQQPVTYDPKATCPAIMEFLHDILDEESVKFVIEWLAYMCLPYTSPDKILFLYGKGGNGKSILMNIFKAFLGTDNITNLSLVDLQEDKFSRAHLYGKLGNICGDIDNKVLNNTGIIKSLTGGDSVYAQFKGVDGFTFQNQAKLMFSANDLPMSTDKTDGYFRRIFILPFEKQIPEAKKVEPNILNKRLTAQKELSGLLNLVIEAIHRLEKNNYKFTVPESAKRALDQYQYAHDKIEQFIDGECVSDKLNIKLRAKLQHFYSAYTDWCYQNGVKAEGLPKVREKLLEKGYDVRKSTGNKAYVFGLTFPEQSEYYKKY